MNKSVINLYGDPGTGKSTIAAGLFYNLKMLGYRVEYVTEFAKEIVYDNAYKVLDDQIYLFGEQQHRLKRCMAENEIIIMDSPLLLSVVYDKSSDLKLRDLVISEYGKYNNVDIFLSREMVSEYSNNGRLEDQHQAKLLDEKIYSLLNELMIEFMLVKTDKSAVEVILNRIMIRKGEKL